MTVSAELLALLRIDPRNGQDDVLYGDDFLLGTIGGGAGNDYVEGKGGLDLLTGGTGTDTVGYSESDVGVHINLGNLLLGLLGAWGGDADGDVLVNGFENVVGSAHADDITGDAGANILVGLEDADRLDGSGGDDTLIGGIGADELIGGRGSDTASYALATAGVAVSLSTGTGTQGEAAGDTLTGIENLTGSAFADVLEGSALANRIQAGAGDDTIIGTDGLDVIDGGAGDDTLDFSASTTGVTIDFGTGRYTSIESILGGKGGDTISLAAPTPAGLMTVATAAEDTPGTGADGGDGDDTIDGDDAANTLNGGAGNDTLNGGGGNDILIGASGEDKMEGGSGWGERDTAEYAQSDEAVKIDLTAGTASGGHASGDTLAGIENLVGSRFDDTLTGGNGDEILEGGDGNDVLYDSHSTDLLIGGAGQDRIILVGEGFDEPVDTVVYTSIADSTPGNSDVIEGFFHMGSGGGDKVDLRAIDADQTNPSGNDEFFLVTSGAIKPGALTIEYTADTIVKGYVDGDTIADFELTIRGVRLGAETFEL
ncbi:hypothetical protein KXR53_33670 [Inquilinus limosus]|uniref:calcium-binding protein n=1 Tax=Inquilinus limosus TaxID=171674 RepID=UPI003F160EA3